MSPNRTLPVALAACLATTLAASSMAAPPVVQGPESVADWHAAGARFIPLEAAQSDPAYARFGGGSLMAREAGARGIALAPSSPPALDPKTLCR